MAGRKLARYVTALDEDGRMVTFEPGTTVSAKVAEGITPKAFEEPEEASSASEVDEPAPAKKAAAKPSAK